MFDNFQPIRVRLEKAMQVASDFQGDYAVAIEHIPLTAIGIPVDELKHYLTNNYQEFEGSWRYLDYQGIKNSHQGRTASLTTFLRLFDRTLKDVLNYFSTLPEAEKMSEEVGLIRDYRSAMILSLTSVLEMADDVYRYDTPQHENIDEMEDLFFDSIFLNLYRLIRLSNRF